MNKTQIALPSLKTIVKHEQILFVDTKSAKVVSLVAPQARPTGIGFAPGPVLEPPGHILVVANKARTIPEINIKKKAIMQRGSIEHEQIIYESSNRRMKQLMDWLSNSH